MSSVGIAFSDVVTDALMVEKGQPRGLTGWLQSIQGTAMYAAMTANLIQLDFAARVCPPHAAGTVFALLMALSNAGLSLSVLVGSYLYGWATAWWDARGAFDFLVLVGALTTAGCWLLIPVLRRHWGSAGVAGG